ncbi:MAG: hypothetical protein ABH952_07655 [Candidatus Omnitrophota bacterium]
MTNLMSQSIHGHVCFWGVKVGIIICLCLIFSVEALAVTVCLKNGSEFECSIIEKTDEGLWTKMIGQDVFLTYNEIETIGGESVQKFKKAEEDLEQDEENVQELPKIEKVESDVEFYKDGRVQRKKTDIKNAKICEYSRYNFSMQIYPEFAHEKKRESKQWTMHAYYGDNVEIVIGFIHFFDEKMKSLDWELFNNNETYNVLEYKKVIHKRKIDKPWYNGYLIMGEQVKDARYSFMETVKLFPKSDKKMSIDIRCFFNKRDDPRIQTMIDSIKFDY